MKYFNKQQIEEVSELNKIAEDNSGMNDKRVANALGRIIEILLENLKERPANERNTVAEEFEENLIEWCLEDVFIEYFMACENTAQYDRGLMVCNDLLALELFDREELENDKVELLAATGKIDEAEKILLPRIEKESNSIWTYIRLGDIYDMYQVLNEHKQLEKAEEWYYRAYDRGIQVDTDMEDWSDLLERLGDICVRRLRNRALSKLGTILKNAGLKGAETLEDFKRSVYISGTDSVVYAHIQSYAYQFSDKSSKELKKINDFLHIVTNAYNLLPQRALDGFCPFEMVKFFPMGEHEARIKSEVMDLCLKAVENGEANIAQGAKEAERYSEIQIEFMKGVDPKTGKIRGKLIEKERAKTKKAYYDGKLIWTGFTEYRGRDYL